MSHERLRTLVGWAAVIASTFLGCFWALWGAIEAFHEGWYYDSVARNIALTLAQYLSPAILFVGVGLVAQRWPRFGAAVHLLLAAGAVLFIRTPAATTWVAIPFLVMGLAYGIARVPRTPWSAALVVVAPLGVALISGSGPAIRTAARVDDGRRDARVIAGNGVSLEWAAEGPGWPTSGVSWQTAVERCEALNGTGAAAAATSGPWRLPTADEVVRTMGRHGVNAGGVWDSAGRRATYRMSPDKETPLWNPHSQVIYWWTATQVDSLSALSVAYDGKVRPRQKRLAHGYLGYRCVRSLLGR